MKRVGTDIVCIQCCCWFISRELESCEKSGSVC